MLELTEPYLQKAWETSGYNKFTPIQEKTFPIITEGKDIIAESPTGSGKTLAYLLPLIKQIDTNLKNAQVLILAPSHELVMQINQELQSWTKDSGILSATLIGGANVKRQIEKLKKKPQIIIGSPGRVAELVKIKKLKLHQIKTVVLDEVDQLLIPEHQNTIVEIVKSTPKERQLLAFSATLPDTIETQVEKWMNKPELIRVNKMDMDIPEVEHMYLVSEARDKIETLRKIIRILDRKALVFFRDIANLTVMAEKLEYKGIKTSAIHRDQKKQDRERAIKQFRGGDAQVLLATDVAARGLDIKDLEYVIHMDVPLDATQYTHRSGRTGRLGSDGGTVISIVTSGEAKVLKKFGREVKVDLIEKNIYKGKIINK
ncbi:DEAD/DEAH box helicase [Aquibacillus kalidii]|uniref:DEAD/DEAH box helicase n=1 Tax=Aquibacillus kalidii TaxID=2762597 RepID=UPI0016448388|nr:DEAD/DEAH box helicase [Aquibacillus kalidii]